MPSKKETAQATKLVDKLIADELLELVDGATTDAVIQAVTGALVLWTDNYDRSSELAELLAAIPDVAEVFASDAQLAEAIATWRRAVRPPKIAITDERNPELEAKLLAEPDDDLAAVYADWLIERGNPLGELFACATNTAARKRVLAKHGAVLWGNVAEYSALFDISWGPTGITALAVERSTPLELEWGRVTGALLDRPLAAFCRALRIGPLPSSAYTQFDELLEHVAARPRPTLERLEVRASEHIWAVVGVSDLATGFPALRELVVSSRRVDGPLAHPTLARLRVGVESLVILGDVLRRIELPNLRHLALGTRDPQSGERAVADILAVPWLAQLEELDLTGLSLDRTARDHLARHDGLLSHLRLSL